MLICMLQPAVQVSCPAGVDWRRTKMDAHNYSSIEVSFLLRLIPYAYYYFCTIHSNSSTLVNGTFQRSVFGGTRR